MMSLLRRQQGWRVPRVSRREQGPSPPHLGPPYHGGEPGNGRGVVLMVAVVRQRLHSGALRLRSSWLQILQTALAACLAWFLAVLILGLERPTFAPIAAVIVLGVGGGGRPPRGGGAEPGGGLWGAHRGLPRVGGGGRGGPGGGFLGGGGGV